MILNKLLEIKNLKHKADKAFELDQLADDPIKKELLEIIFDKDIRFFVDVDKVDSNVDVISGIFTKTDDELEIELLQLLKVLSSGELRGNEGIQKCVNYAEQLPSLDTTQMFYNILDNKTRLGIGATDINKYCVKFKINQFMVMYALQWKKAKPDWKLKYVIQPKIDGNRQICIYKAATQFFSRTGKLTISLKEIEQVISATLPIDNPQGMILDGEVECGTLEATGCIRRKEDQAEKAIYTIFGIYNPDQWDSGKHTDTYDVVYDRAKRWITRNGPFENIRLIPSYPIEAKSEEEFHELVQKYTQEFIEQGYEGSVLKEYNHVYIPSAGSKRTNAWIKIKPELDSINECVRDTDGIILEILPEENNPSMVGKFWVKWLDDKFKVSPGKMSHKTRKHIMENAKDYLGEKLEFRFQCLSEKGIPRNAFATKIRKEII